MMKRVANSKRASLWAWIVIVLIAPLPAGAHNGPPFPIVENRKIGGYVVSLWTHPDIGTGTFFVLMEPVAGGKIPARSESTDRNSAGEWASGGGDLSHGSG